LTARSTSRAGSSEVEAVRSPLVHDDDRRRTSEQGDDDRGCRGDHGGDVHERCGQRRDQRSLSDRSDSDRWGPGDNADDECDHATAVGGRLRSAEAMPAPATVSRGERNVGVRRSRRRSTTWSGSRRRRSRGSRSRRRPSSSSDDGGGGNRRYRIRLGTSDVVGSLETFWAHFENCTAYNWWSEADRLGHLKASLTGNAGEVVWASDAAATDTLAKLTALLRGRYRTSRQADKYRMELRLRRRRAGESLTVLRQDIRRLMALAHPSLPQDARESIACDCYIDGLGDPDFALKALRSTPP